MEQLMEYLPWVIAAAVGWFILGKLLKLAQTVISIGCSLIAVALVIIILVNLL